MINLAKGWSKRNFGGKRRFDEKHNRKNQSNSKKRRLLDTGRRKLFLFDLDDLFEKYGLRVNKSIMSATLANKLTTQSMDDAMEYVKRLGEENELGDKEIESFEKLMRRYTRWR